MNEYATSLKQYEDKISKIIQQLIALETKKVKLINPFISEHKRLLLERKRVDTLIRKTQDDYMNKGIIETKVYDGRMVAYIERLSDIEEALANQEALIAIKKASRKFFKTPKTQE